MRLRERVCSCVLLCSLSMGSLMVSAEDRGADRGRLPDGRAFRTDNNGNQLIDYIAELEMSVETVRQQLRTVEGELEACTAGDTGTNAAPAQPVSAPVRVQCPERECPPADCSSAVTEAKALNQGALQSLKMQVGELKQSLSEREATLRNYEKKLSEAEGMRTEVSGRISGRESEVRRMQLQLASLNDEYDELRGKIEKREGEVETLRARMASAEADATASRERLEKLESQKAELTVRAEAKQKVVEASRAAYSFSESGKLVPTLGDSQLSALESTRERLYGQLSQIQKLILQRDNMFAEYDKTPRPFDFTPVAARSFRGRTLAELRTAVEGATSFREISRISDEIRGVRARIQGDIGLMQRTWNRTGG